VRRDDYARRERDHALSLTEAELRERVDRLLEQAGREQAHPAPSSSRSQMLYVSEIFWLLGLGPRPGLPELKALQARIMEAEG